MPLQQTSGNVTADAYGGGAAAVPNYIESVFSTYLYTGNGTTQTITNGIDLAGKGGLVWTKNRGAADSHRLFNTVNGGGYFEISNSTAAQVPASFPMSFNSTGWSTSDDGSVGYNTPGNTYVSWTFRKQPKFFDVVTYTGNGSWSTSYSHNLGSRPGLILIKRLNGATDWAVWHRGTSDGSGGGLGYTALSLNTTAAGQGDTGTLQTATTFCPGGIAPSTAGTQEAACYEAGGTYVAYLFAHNAGGFGLTGTDNVISCGVFTTDASGNATVNLGYEPQFVIFKCSSSADNWYTGDVMRGMSQTNFNYLLPNSSAAEASVGAKDLCPTATGFTVGPYTTLPSKNYIYIAIRRGPMKTPTSGTSVFTPVTQAVGGFVSTGFPVDAIIETNRGNPSAVGGIATVDRLRGSNIYQITSSSAAENQVGFVLDGFNNSNVGYQDNAYSGTGGSGIYWNFRRAPGFFDEVCFDGTGSYPLVLNHNLTVVPELMLFKRRNGAESWFLYASPITSPNASWYKNYLVVNNNGSVLSDTTSITTAPTSTAVTIASYFGDAGKSYVLYLFASCPGVSKVFSFTGNGTTQTINCGFTGGARFVLLKASSATGGWYVYDTARGMTTLTDPYLFLDSTAAETATLGSVTTVTGGFAVNEAITTGVNTNGVTYIGLAIA